MMYFTRIYSILFLCCGFWITAAVQANATILFTDDFETDQGWAVNADGTDTATTGMWERVDPSMTFHEDHGPIQRETAAYGDFALITGGSTDDREAAGSNDVDDGITTIRSPIISLPTSTPLTLSFLYYFGHINTANSNDAFRVSIITLNIASGDDLTSNQEEITQIYEETADSTWQAATWQEVSLSLDQFAGKSFFIEFAAVDDTSNSSIIEAGVDNVRIISRFTPAETAPDASGWGDLAVTNAEYRFPASVDNDILAGRRTEIWARVYRPADLSQGPYPIVMVLHGNHATCGRGSDPRIDDNIDYTTTGVCPAGYTVVPNHDGYAYFAEPLASHGYIVVSINANRGINAGAGVSGDSGLTLARGKLILKHLALLNQWSTTGGAPSSLGVGGDGLIDKIDFNEVGLVGHSRGGEGVRAAYELYRDINSPWPAQIPNLRVQGIFEIAPVDGYADRILNADSTAWAVLLPMCDRDVSYHWGFHPFGRAMLAYDEVKPSMKAMLTVWGTNHNFFNTEWQQNDLGVNADDVCYGQGNYPIFNNAGPSQPMETIGRSSILAFLRGNVGADADIRFTNFFDPRFPLPPTTEANSEFDRSFSASPNRLLTAVIDDFEQAAGTSSNGVSNDSRNITIENVYVLPSSNGFAPDIEEGVEALQRGAKISWDSPSNSRYLQTNWRNPGQGENIRNYTLLEFRAGRQNSVELNQFESTNFSIQLVNGDGTVSSAVQLEDYVTVRSAGYYLSPDFAVTHPALPTARIPLLEFTGADLGNIRGVRFTFNDDSSAIYIANVRLIRELVVTGDSLPSEPPSTGELYPDTVEQAAATAQMTTLTLRGIVPFPLTNALPKLFVGNQATTISAYGNGDGNGDGNDMSTLIFSLDDEQIEQLRNGSRVVLRMGAADFRYFEPLDITTWEVNEIVPRNDVTD